jgi:ubiquinone/menaquinone biosynthesis C-methylase UbiE
LAKVCAGDLVLEIGCGTGLFTRKFYEATHANITAIDISDDLLETARQLLPEANFMIDDAMHLSQPDNTFKVVFGSSVLHHLEFEASLNEIYRVLQPGGRMIFAEPNMLNPQIFYSEKCSIHKIMAWRLA